MGNAGLPTEASRMEKKNMGQHKYNLTAQAAKAGKLPPRPRKMSKRECDRSIMALIAERIEIEYLKYGVNAIKKPYF